jgi:hypothetical protein
VTVLLGAETGGRDRGPEILGLNSGTPSSSLAKF